MIRFGVRLLKSRARAACLFAFIASLFAACTSENKTALGNSAESGNPEIAGVLTLSDGSFARKAKVMLIPADYQATDGLEIDSAWTSFTDSLGQFSFENVPAKTFSLEAMDLTSGQMLLKMGIEDSDSTIEFEGTLENAGGVRLGAHGFADGSTGIVYVPGTTILRRVTVELGNIFVDSLPADSLRPFIFVSDDGYALSLERGVSVVADSIVEVDAEKVSLRFRYPLDMSVSGIALSENLVEFPLRLSLDSSDFDFDGLDRVEGVWTAILCGDTIPLDVSYADPAAGKFAFWARIPKLRANSIDTLWLHFDEGALASEKSAKNVFSNGYVAAWHFDEGADSVRDATGNGFDGVPEFVTAAERSVSGGALYFGGKSGSVTIPNSATGDFDVAFGDQITFTVWARMADLSQSRVIFGKGASQYHLMFLYGSSGSQWLYEFYSDEIPEGDTTSASMRFWYTDTSVAAEKWTFFAIVQDSAGISLYVDDTLATSTPRRGTSSSARITDSLFVIGKLIYPAEDPTDIVTHYFKGEIDELHVSRTARSEAWIRTTRLNQDPENRWPLPEPVR